MKKGSTRYLGSRREVSVFLCTPTANEMTLRVGKGVFKSPQDTQVHRSHCALPSKTLHLSGGARVHVDTKDHLRTVCCPPSLEKTADASIANHQHALLMN